MNRLATIIWLCCFVLQAAEYFVSPNGSDKNNGSLEAPFASVIHATTKIVPGDTVTLRGGIYREAVTIHNSGLPDKPITFWGTGVNAIHLGCDMGDKIEIYNNILFDTVSNHHNAAITVADHGKHVYCDYNLYWKKRCTEQCCYAFGRYKPGHEYSSPGSIKNKDMARTLQDTRQRFGIEEHGLEADPLFVDINRQDFGVKPGSPALKRGKDGKDIGADFAIFR